MGGKCQSSGKAEKLQCYQLLGHNFQMWASKIRHLSNALILQREEHRETSALSQSRIDFYTLFISYRIRAFVAWFLEVLSIHSTHAGQVFTSTDFLPAEDVAHDRLSWVRPECKLDKDCRIWPYGRTCWHPKENLEHFYHKCQGQSAIYLISSSPKQDTPMQYLNFLTATLPFGMCKSLGSVRSTSKGKKQTNSKLFWKCYGGVLFLVRLGQGFSLNILG